MTMFGYMFPTTFGSKPSITHIPIALVNEDRDNLSTWVVLKFRQSATSTGMFDVKEYGSISQAKDALVRGNVKGIVIFKNGFGDQLTSGRQAYVTLIVDKTSSTMTQIIVEEVTVLLNQISNQISKDLINRMELHQNPSYLIKPVSLKLEEAVPGAPSTFEYLAPGFMALTVVMAGLSGVAASIARERETGTFVEILVSPISGTSVIFGKALAQTVRGIIQALMVLILSIILFGVKVYGNLFLMFFVLLLTVLSFVGIGIIATTIAAEQETAMLVLFLIQFPMMFLCGVFFPIEQMPLWMQQIARVIPLTYAVQALRKVIIFGAGLGQVLPEVLVLALWSVVTISIAVPLFKKALTR